LVMLALVQPVQAATSASSGTKPVFADYYLWWDGPHWTSHLGPNYPYTQEPNPLPATLDTSSCGTLNNYPGNVETDVSQNLLYDQSNYQTILADVQEAAAAGLTGFAVDWAGDGTTTQTATSYTENQRLAYVFQAVHAVNAQGVAFKIILNYESSASLLTMQQFTNDFNYFLATYGNDPALDHTYSTAPEVIMAGSWKYPDADLQGIYQQFGYSLYLIGDERPTAPAGGYAWDAARAASLDGATWYWSSQDPNTDASSFAIVQSFASTIRSTPNANGTAKIWLAPFTPGYNGMLYYNTSTCVPRNEGQTMHALFDGNLQSNPDGWNFISWNEITEGTYVVPLTRYGDAYINTLKALIQAGQ
jgi:hypothetical protein